MHWCDIYIEYTKLSVATFSNLTFILYITAGESVRMFTFLLRYAGYISLQTTQFTLPHRYPDRHKNRQTLWNMCCQNLSVQFLGQCSGENTFWLTSVFLSSEFSGWTVNKLQVHWTCGGQSSALLGCGCVQKLINAAFQGRKASTHVWRQC